MDRCAREILTCHRRICRNAGRWKSSTWTSNNCWTEFRVPQNKQKREKIRKPVYFGVRRTMRKERVNVVYCPVFSIHDMLVWKKVNIFLFVNVLVESQHDIFSQYCLKSDTWAHLWSVIILNQVLPLSYLSHYSVSTHSTALHPSLHPEEHLSLLLIKKNSPLKIEVCLLNTYIIKIAFLEI